MWMNALILDKSIRRAAFKLVCSVAEYDKRERVIATNYEYHKRALEEWQQKWDELSRDSSYDEPIIAFEKLIDRELTTAEWNGDVPVGWDGTKEEYQAWEEAYIEQSDSTHHKT